MASPVRVALVAGEREPARALAGLLREIGGFGEVLECRGLAEARRRLRERPEIDLAFVDLGSSAADQASALFDLRLLYGGLRVVALARTEARGDVLACLHAGAHGYIPTSLDPPAFAEAVAAVCAGRVYVPASLSALPAPAPGGQGRPRRHSRDAGLTARQADVLGHLRAGRSTRDIAMSLHLAENTVKVHIHTIFRKLGVSRREEVIDLP
ncbi:LuxR C-terminal-related transcriptional regulator [Methylobacterium oxalidis]|uniref:DNA-binding response regulator n=1 Tax=Methylobacterium oxalidis TaxID=944322 RepID=A0A512IZJ3_9HYPH|nr:response regulator transcription factor [Methylobacterium oxalidis]GEP03127.1 DNA-binding response regulator [Methylobacterium oxalidis]GJE30347.1 HTH-type transcriptional regulator MalT [Methylobacterium oxalidis]GLS67386.1 DNA-binding response regulator [Methylobacterium oxalidis]